MFMDIQTEFCAFPIACQKATTQNRKTTLAVTNESASNTSPAYKDVYYPLGETVRGLVNFF